MTRPIRLTLIAAALVLGLVLALVLTNRSDQAIVQPRLAPLMVMAPKLPPTITRRLPETARAPVGERIPVTLTAYCLKGRTREGRAVAPNLVAADPRVFPLGRSIELFVGGERRGRFRVSDTGRLVKGTVIDLWMDSCAEARRFGRRRGMAILLPPQSEAAS